MADDYYEILGVKPDANESTIKSAFRRVAKANHPDRAQAQGWSRAETAQRERTLKQAATAYAVLRDPRLRGEFDRERRSDRLYQTYQRARNWRPNGPTKAGGVPGPWSGINFEDLGRAQAAGGAGSVPPAYQRKRRPKELRPDFKTFREMAAEAAERILCELILENLEDL